MMARIVFVALTLAITIGVTGVISQEAPGQRISAGYFLTSDDPCSTVVVFKDRAKASEWAALQRQVAASYPALDDAHRALAKVSPAILGRLPPDLLVEWAALEKVRWESINAEEASNAAVALSDSCLARIKTHPQAEVAVMWDLARKWQAATGLPQAELVERFRVDVGTIRQQYGTPLAASQSMALLLGQLQRNTVRPAE